jgi:hypothetical protein
MDLPVREVDIGERHYTIHTLLLSKGQEVLIRLLRNTGPALGELVSGAKASAKGAPTTTAEALGRAIKDLCLRVDSADLTYIRTAFGEVTYCNGQALQAKVQEIHFAGRLGEMTQWLEECIAHNYADFLAFALSAASSAGPQTAAESPSPSASTGSSGG